MTQLILFYTSASFLCIFLKCQTKKIEKELSLWDRMKVKFGGLAFVIVAATIIYLTWFIKRKDRQNI